METPISTSSKEEEFTKLFKYLFNITHLRKRISQQIHFVNIIKSPHGKSLGYIQALNSFSQLLKWKLYHLVSYIIINEPLILSKQRPSIDQIRDMIRKGHILPIHLDKFIEAAKRDKLSAYNTPIFWILMSKAITSDPQLFKRYLLEIMEIKIQAFNQYPIHQYVADWGNIELLKVLFEVQPIVYVEGDRKIEEIISRVFEAAATPNYNGLNTNGNIHVLEKFNNGKSQVDMIKYIHVYFGLVDVSRVQFDSLAARGDVDTFLYLAKYYREEQRFTHYYATKITRSTLAQACLSSNLPLIRYLVEEMGITPTKEEYYSLSSYDLPSLELVKYMQSKVSIDDYSGLYHLFDRVVNSMHPRYYKTTSNEEIDCKFQVNGQCTTPNYCNQFIPLFDYILSFNIVPNLYTKKYYHYYYYYNQYHYLYSMYDDIQSITNNNAYQSISTKLNFDTITPSTIDNNIYYHEDV